MALKVHWVKFELSEEQIKALAASKGQKSILVKDVKGCLEAFAMSALDGVVAAMKAVPPVPVEVAPPTGSATPRP